MERISLSLYCALAVFFLLIQHGSCVKRTDAQNLREKLFVTDKYDKTVRPRINLLYYSAVYVELSLLSINELNEKTETLKITAYLTIGWIDEFLTWDPKDYGGINLLHLPQGDVWKPDVTLKNSYQEYKELGVSSLNVEVDSDGIVFWRPFQVFESTCSMDITYFPYDVQECKLIFVAWSYHHSAVRMFSGDKGIQLNEFETNPEWEVIDTRFYNGTSSVSSAVFSVTMKRKPLHVLLSVIMPIIMLAILNIFVFVIPCKSGEKASYAITVFLAFAVFLSIISSTFPENSKTIPVFSKYLIILTLQSTIISLLALSLMRCTSFDDDKTPVPRYIKAFLSVFRCRPCRARKVSNRNAYCEYAIKMEESNKRNPPYTDENAEASASPEQVLYSDYSWKDVTKTFDKVFFVLFSLVLIASTMYFGFSVVVNN